MEGSSRALLWALPWADRLLQTLHEHLCMLWALAQHGWHGPFQASSSPALCATQLQGLLGFASARHEEALDTEHRQFCCSSIEGIC